MIDVSELRAWIQLVFVVVGGTIGLVAFLQNMRQRRLENALKVIALFKESLLEGDVAAWHELFHASSEPAGAKPGHYKFASSQVPIGNYFSEGSHDGGAIARMADSLEVVCFELRRKTIDARYVWFELGQYLQTMHTWLSQIDGPSGKLLEQFPAIKGAFHRHGDDFLKWPRRTLSYVE